MSIVNISISGLHANNSRCKRLLRLATQYAKMDWVDEALRLCRSIVRDYPNYVPCYELMLELYLAEGSPEQLVKIKTLISSCPDTSARRRFVPFHVRSIEKCEGPEAAIDFALNLYEVDKENLHLRDILLELSIKYRNSGLAMRFAGSLTCLGQTEGSIVRRRADILRFNGHYDSAAKIYRSMTNSAASAAQGYIGLNSLRTYKFNEYELAHMESIESRVDLKPQDRIGICYALGRAYEGFSDYDNAFLRYSQANNLKRKIQGYSPDLIDAKFEALKAVAIEACPLMGEIEALDESPIFLVGLHRSGSTLVEQFLTSHSKVGFGAELDDIRAMEFEITKRLGDGQIFSESIALKYLMNISPSERDSLGKRYLDRNRILKGQANCFVDKMPRNFLSVPFILSIIPGAKIIDVRRDPKSVALSIFRHNLPPAVSHANRLEDILHYYKRYVDIMELWSRLYPGRIYLAKYESIVENPASEIARILNFCGLELEDECINFHLTGRMATIPSSLEVNMPIYLDGISEWKNYQKYIAPLFLENH